MGTPSTICVCVTTSNRCVPGHSFSTSGDLRNENSCLRVHSGPTIPMQTYLCAYLFIYFHCTRSYLQQEGSLFRHAGSVSCGMWTLSWGMCTLSGSMGNLVPWPGINGEGNGNLLLYSCLENSMPRGVWQAAVHGVTESQTRLKHTPPGIKARPLALWVQSLSHRTTKQVPQSKFLKKKKKKLLDFYSLQSEWFSSSTVIEGTTQEVKNYTKRESLMFLGLFKPQHV